MSTNYTFLNNLYLCPHEKKRKNSAEVKSFVRVNQEHWFGSKYLKSMLYHVKVQAFSS
jgi:hypothetical protein